MVEDDVGLVMLTSGSSGFPNSELTWEALEASAVITKRVCEGNARPFGTPYASQPYWRSCRALARNLRRPTLLWGDESDIDGATRHGATHIALVRTQLARHDVRLRESAARGARPPSALGRTSSRRGHDRDVQALFTTGELSKAWKSSVLRANSRYALPRSFARTGVWLVHGYSARWADDWFPTGDAATSSTAVSVKGRVGYVINTVARNSGPTTLKCSSPHTRGQRRR